MTTEIKIIGTKTLGEVKIKHVEGGFGEKSKCVLASDVALKHGQPIYEINRLINRNIGKFSENDLIDFLNGSETYRQFAKENELFKSNRTKNIFLLSERGYLKLVSMLDNDNDTKWDVMQEFIDGYFKLREEVKISQRALLLEHIYNGGQEAVIASKELTKLETAPLHKQITEQQPKVEFADLVNDTTDLIDVGAFSKVLYDKHKIDIGRSRLFAWLRTSKYLMEGNLPYQQYVEMEIFKVRQVVKKNQYADKTFPKCFITGKGQIYLTKKIIKHIEEFGKII